MKTKLTKQYRRWPGIGLCGYMIVLLLMFGISANAQEFNLTVTATDEICPGSGTLTFALENADPAAPVNYKVYKLPNTTTPISNNSATSVSGLIAGNYLIVATQAVNGNTITDQEQVTIADLTIPLVYTVESDNSYCGPDGSISITVTSGTASAYEIIDGPVIRTAQPTPVFNNLPAGSYQVRVVDNCGSAEVITLSVFSDGPILQIGGPAFPDQMLPACDLITAENVVGSVNGVDIAYPLNAVFTVYPPGGGTPVVYSQSITAGGTQSATATQVIPFYYNTPYYYQLEITDPCGTVYTFQNLVQQKMNAMPGFSDLGCGMKAFMISMNKFMPPYNVTFTNVPEGFDPSAFNTTHPGPFTDGIIYYGNPENPVPFGIYTYTVTDACGHTTTHEAEYIEPEIEPIASPFAADCLGNPGRVEVNIPGYIIGIAEITEAPEEYEALHPLAYDVSEFITIDDGLKVGGLLPGEYTVVLIDTCGTRWPDVHFEILQAPGGVSNPMSRPDCTPGKGAVYMAPQGGQITMVKIMTAPAEFTEPLPYDATFNIAGADGSFYMDNLPPGTYTLLVDTTCQTGISKTVTIVPYNSTVNTLNITRHCGSFDLHFQHSSNAVAFLSFYLQLQDPVTGNWVRPDTGESEPAGEAPVDPDNGLPLTNNATMFTLTQTGIYRIVKVYQSFPSGSVATKKFCMEPLHEFDFFDDLQITGIVSLTCSGAVGDVQVNVEGVSPLTYEIISKNGDNTFNINNGNNNVFNSLETAVYRVRVADPCGNYQVELFNVADLPSLVEATQPDDLHLCDTDNNGTEVFDLSQQDAAILNGQDAAMVAITYHASDADADTGNNPLPVQYECGTSAIYARLVYDNNTACTAKTSFTVNAHPSPDLQMDGIMTGCEGTPLEIVADAGYDYLWSGGEMTQSITVTEPGDYTVKVTNEFGCEAEKTIQVSFSPLPQISHIEISDWTDENNVITVIMEDPSQMANFEYSLDGMHYQDSNVFSGLSAGRYIVYVRDKFKCGRVSMPAFLLTYPKFFTPNGDGINDTWRIQFSILEPDMLIYIYDRYGKLITGFGTDSMGWDGTLNGTPLPATDYWFVVKRQDGREMRGHFSMIR